MIDDVVKFLRDRLNRALPRDASGGAVEDLFAFIAAGKDDTLSFKADAVTVMLVRIEQENTLRPPDPYTRFSPAGLQQKVEPEIRLSLSVLIVARFPDDYLQSLHQLSRVIRYFQNHRVFTPDNSPDLPQGLSQLVIELLTPSLAEQNEMWATLRTAYQPSALYKLRMVVFKDDDGAPGSPVQEIVQNVSQVPPT